MILLTACASSLASLSRRRFSRDSCWLWASFSPAADSSSDSAVLERELEALLHQAQQLADSAAGAARTAESLHAGEALLLSQAADARASLSALRSGLHEVEERRAHVTEELSAGDCRPPARFSVSASSRRIRSILS